MTMLLAAEGAWVAALANALDGALFPLVIKNREENFKVS